MAQYLRYLAKVIDKNSGVTLRTSHFSIKQKAIDYVQKCPEHRQIVLDILDNGRNSLSHKLVFSN